MKVLVGCEESQAVTIAFRNLGHEAYSCDLLPCSGGHPEWHIQGDVTELIKQDWDLIIAFPPCTYLSNAGACRLYPKKGELNLDRYRKGLEGKEFFMQFFNANCKYIAIENPVASSIFQLPKYDQVVQPYWFGHPFSKKTCLWLKGLPLLKPTNMVSGEIKSWVNAGSKDHNGNPRKQTGKHCNPFNRSKTFQGIADAMAEQWHEFITNQSVKTA